MKEDNNTQQDESQDQEKMIICEVLFGIPHERGNEIQASIMDVVKTYSEEVDVPNWRDASIRIRKDIIDDLGDEKERQFAYLTVGQMLV